jgi:uncharacterized protein YutD
VEFYFRTAAYKNVGTLKCLIIQSQKSRSNENKAVYRCIFKLFEYSARFADIFEKNRLVGGDNAIADLRLKLSLAPPRI